MAWIVIRLLIAHCELPGSSGLETGVRQAWLRARPDMPVCDAGASRSHHARIALSGFGHKKNGRRSDRFCLAVRDVPAVWRLSACRRVEQLFGVTAARLPEGLPGV